jgi:tRNA(Ile)-lysidine synthase
MMASAARSTALAVSGGSDSSALMLLFQQWLTETGQSPAAVLVLTVDHGLRADSRSEAETVAHWARGLGYQHVILPWLGPKPKTGVQAAARQARYRLLGEHLRSAGRNLLVTAHTADDQAETLLMRLARGSGLDGLAAMAPWAPLDLPCAEGQPPLWLARPLLGLSKSRLEATLRAAGVSWLQDPSNAALRFERARLRARGEILKELGLTEERLALSAWRLQRARAALDQLVADFCADASRYRVDPLGFISIDTSALDGLANELVVRVLIKAIAAVGGSLTPVPLAKVERLAAALSPRGGGLGTWTLARARIKAEPDNLLIEREPGRRPWPEIALAPGARALWDGRFWVAAGPKLGQPVCVRALGRAGVGVLRKQAPLPAGVPIDTLRALPGFWHEAELIAAPNLTVARKESLQACGFSAVFAPLAGF